jgi:hypothetical protein
MGRYIQPTGMLGSLKWIQRSVNQKPACPLDQMILSALDGATKVSWLSPLSSDEFAEYRDAAFLEKVGTAHLVPELECFWPRWGPQWDALGCSDAEDVLLVEAKAHIKELFSPPSRAGSSSRAVIDRAFHETASHLGAGLRVQWADIFYQLANRLAHLYFLRKHGVKAWLLLVNFVGDAEVNGPTSRLEWMAAYQVVWHALGVEDRSSLSAYIIHIYPDVRTLGN